MIHRGRRGGAGTLELRGVSKSFERTTAGGERLVVLDSIDLDVGPEESVGLIGPNGAGKSTLLKLASGVTPPTAGTIRRHGRTCSVIELGAAVHPDLSGRENVELLASLYGIPRRRLPRLLDTIVGFAELEHAIDWPTRRYSTGMVARLAFATAAYSDPDLLLIDEVLSVGDLPFQYRCRERVEELRREGVTVLLVSHDLDLVTAVCDRTVLLRGARVEADGPSARIVNRYLGQPDPGDPADAPLELVDVATRVATGDPVQFTVRLRDGLGEAEVGVDLVISEHPTLSLHGIEQSVIFASHRLRVTPDRRTFRLSTDHLPPGRYELHARLDPDGEVRYAAPVGVVITGRRPDLYAMQLRATCSVRPVGHGAAARPDATHDAGSRR